MAIEVVRKLEEEGKRLEGMKRRLKTWHWLIVGVAWGGAVMNVMEGNWAAAMWALLVLGMSVMWGQERLANLKLIEAELALLKKLVLIVAGDTTGDAMVLRGGS